MTDRFAQIRGIVQEFLDDANKTSAFFKWLEILNRNFKQNIDDLSSLLDTIEKSHPGLKATHQEIRNKIIEARSNADTFQMIYYILEILALRSLNVPRIKEAEWMQYDHEKMLSEEDRKSLDWLNKFIKHNPGGSGLE